MILKDKTIIVCCIVRDAGKGLKRNIPAIKDILMEFKGYKVIVFENNSKDDTKEILTSWMNEDKENVIAIMTDIDANIATPSKVSKVGASRFFCHKRIDKMATLRNQYMEYIDSHGWTADYLMVVDLDVEQIYAKPVINTLQLDREWDSIATYGFGIRAGFKRCYYDTYALTKWDDRDSVQTEKIIYESNRSLDNVKKTDNWIRVASAFGGMVIYKFEAIKGLRYLVYDNDDERVEVRCEHYSIYKQMRERGYDKFYIVPAMQLKYQAFTWTVFCRAARLYWHKYILRD